MPAVFNAAANQTTSKRRGITSGPGCTCVSQPPSNSLLNLSSSDRVLTRFFLPDHGMIQIILQPMPGDLLRTGNSREGSDNCNPARQHKVRQPFLQMTHNAFQGQFMSCPR